MKMRLGLAAVIAGLSGGLAGCGPDCVSLCEEADEQRCWNGVSCDTYCEMLDEVAAESGCEDEADEAIACSADQIDVCNTDVRCAPEENRFAQCTFSYCVGHLADCAILAR